MSAQNSFSQSRARWIVPLVGALAALLLGTLLIYPMLKMEPQDIPVAILSLDEGVTVNGTYVNAGDKVVEAITNPVVDEGSGASTTSSDIAIWTVFKSQQELDQAMENGEHYAAVTIPADFSESQAAVLGRQAIGNGLVENLPELTEGVSALSDGSTSLHEGAVSLAGGIEQIAAGTQTLDTQVAALPSQTQSLAEGSSSLAGGLTRLEQGAESLSAGITNAKAGVDGADGAIEAAMAALSSSTPDVATAMHYLASAKKATAATSQGIGSLAEGAQSLSTGLSSSKVGAESLNGYLVTFASSAPALSQGVSSLSSGMARLNGGASALKDGTKALSDGTTTLAETFTSANNVLSELPPMKESASDTSADASGIEAMQDLDMGAMGTESSSSASNAASIELLINQSKNPMISSSLQSALSTMSSSSGISFDTEYLNPLPDEMNMGFTHMILMILTYISSYATAAVIANVLKLKKDSRSNLLRSLGIQLAYAVSLALVIGVGIASILTLTVSSSISFVDIALYVAIASFSFQLLVIAALNWFGMVGMIVPIGLLVIGMGTAYLPTEFLPSFWQQFVYPWDPLRFMVDGFKDILYMGKGFLNTSTMSLLVVVLIGFTAFAANGIRKEEK